YLYVFLLPRLPSSPLFPYTTLFRSSTTSRPSTGSRPRSPTASASASVEAAAGRAAVGSICSAVHAGANRGVRVTAALSGEDVTKIGRATSELQSLAYLVCRLLLEKK